MIRHDGGYTHTHTHTQSYTIAARVNQLEIGRVASVVAIIDVSDRDRRE